MPSTGPSGPSGIRCAGKERCQNRRASSEPAARAATRPGGNACSQGYQGSQGIRPELRTGQRNSQTGCRKNPASYGAKIVAAKTSDEAVEGADLLITVTLPSKPVFDASKVKRRGNHRACVGAYQPHMQEMDPAILTRASKIYFDSKEAVLSESGDILIPLSRNDYGRRTSRETLET